MTPKKRARFLAELAERGNVKDSCEASCMTREMAYRYRKKDEKFRQEWDAAVEVAADVLEREAWRRAHDGVSEPVFWKGAPCGAVQKYSDVLLIFLLKGLRPAKYRERHEISGDKDNPLVTSFEIKLVKAEAKE